MNAKGRAVTILFLLIFLLKVQGGEGGLKTGAFEEKDLKPKFPIEGRIVFHSNFDGDNEI